MILIRHRINTVEELKTVPRDMGVELDLRYEGEKLILHHDPFAGGEDFESYLKAYAHAFMIVNVKSEGIEQAALELLKKYNVKRYFFLDLTFPALVKLAKKGKKNIAVRFSEYEPLEQCESVAGLVDWVWVDCFQNMPLNSANYPTLKRHFKICLVSPELQNHPLEQIVEFKKKLAAMPVDAVCTKRPDLWR